MKELIIYEFEGAKFTPRPGPNGEPIFDPDEVAAVLGRSSGRQIARMVDDDEKGVHLVDTLGGSQERVYITEPGLYTVLVRSKSPRAKPFRRFVTHEVLPAIRKHGFFVDESQAEKVERLVPGLVAAWKRITFKGVEFEARPSAIPGLPLYLCTEDLPPLQRPVTTISTSEGLLDLVTGTLHPRPYSH